MRDRLPVSLAEELARRGFACLAVRLPGHGTSLAELDEYEQRVRAVTPADMQRVADQRVPDRHLRQVRHRGEERQVVQVEVVARVDAELLDHRPIDDQERRAGQRLLGDGHGLEHVLGTCTAWGAGSLTVDREGHGPVTIPLAESKCELVRK